MYIYDWFEQMSVGRRIGESGPMGLAPSDVLAWSTLSGTAISPIEYEIITHMDVAYVRAVNQFREEQRAKYEAKKEVVK